MSKLPNWLLRKARRLIKRDTVALDKILGEATKSFKWTGWVKPINQAPVSMYCSSFNSMTGEWNDWADITIDNGTTYVHIETPTGWKCKKKGCTTNFKHTHGTYRCLNS